MAPVKVDEVLIFRRSDAVPPIVDDAIQIGAKVVWMQEGIVNEPARPSRCSRFDSRDGRLHACSLSAAAIYPCVMSNIFATLLLAHLLADYPLQTNWMVQAKRTWPGLTLHVGIHLAVMLVLTAPSFAQSWPFLLMLAALHFAIDSLKNILACRRPHWVTGPYLFDQFLHLLAIGLLPRYGARRPGRQPAHRLLMDGLRDRFCAGYVCLVYHRTDCGVRQCGLSAGDHGSEMDTHERAPCC